jgi:hypothetical protein
MYGLAHLAAALARVDCILAVHGRLEAGRLHGLLKCAEESRSGVGGAVLRSSGASRRASHGHPEARAVARYVDERSGVRLVRCRVRVVDSPLADATSWVSDQGGVPEEEGTTEGWDGMIQSDVADRRSGFGRCCPELG